MQSPYFVVSASKEIGLIQCKFRLKDRRWCSDNSSNIIHYNLLVQADIDQSTVVNIQANNIEKKLASEYYRENDLGVSTDKRYLDPLIEFVKNGFRKTDD